GVSAAAAGGVFDFHDDTVVRGGDVPDRRVLGQVGFTRWPSIGEHAQVGVIGLGRECHRCGADCRRVRERAVGVLDGSGLCRVVEGDEAGESLSATVDEAVDEQLVPVRAGYRGSVDVGEVGPVLGRVDQVGTTVDVDR